MSRLYNSTLRIYGSCWFRNASTMQEAKSKLRNHIAEKLKQLTTEEKKKQSDYVVNELFKLPVFQVSERISLFLSTDDEINTKPIMESIFERNRECFVPRYSKKGMEMVKLHSMEDWENLPMTSWKIKQPSLKEQRENALDTGGLDLIIVPGVAFTSDGKRTGHGGGYYDRFIQGIRKNQNKPPSTVALAFKEQIVDDLPFSEYDQRIDKVLYMS
ncbi:hypothetical protein WA026_018377 [Henosepilachna vigintioctopunctata]|uniref:5-formyltetrahydrofolate cyclo-ligase n=1 Tax=Henosepilachna vigintioctopunctata TaxID=420089 RepID=A0AAW1VI56_9CUCU